MPLTNTTVTIFHNPSCSKSRATLALLEEQGISPEVRLYLKEPLSVNELSTVITALGFDSARGLLRTGEALYKSLSLENPNLSEADILNAMETNPKLIERPIVIKDKYARIGRPPEQVLEIL